MTSNLVRVDASHWPLVIARFPERITTEALEHLFVDVETQLKRRERFVQLSDLSAVGSIPGAAERQMIAAWEDSVEPLVAQYNVATAVVVSNPLVRGALTALGWIYRPVVPTEYFANEALAAAYCANALTGASLNFTPALQTYLDALGVAHQAS